MYMCKCYQLQIIHVFKIPNQFGVFFFKKCYYSKHWNSSILGFCLIFCVVTLSYFNLKLINVSFLVDH